MYTSALYNINNWNVST